MLGYHRYCTLFIQAEAVAGLRLDLHGQKKRQKKHGSKPF